MGLLDEQRKTNKLLEEQNKLARMVNAKKIQAEKDANKAAKGSFVDNLIKNVEVTKQRINTIKSFFGKGKQEEPTPSIPQSQSNSSSRVADELKKFKELLDAGVLTQEEFDKKKKELIG